MGKWDDFKIKFDAWDEEWGANALNASITGSLTALSGAIGAFMSNGVYKRYEQQEKLYIKAANENARRLQLQGDIALRNLRMEHTIAQGSRELSAAAGGGRLSGSTLDVLTSSRKAEIMDERTQSLETIWAVSEAKKQGLNQAIQTAWAATQHAETQKAAAVQGLFSGLAAAAGSINEDYRTKKAKEYDRMTAYAKQGTAWDSAFFKMGYDEKGNITFSPKEVTEVISGQNASVGRLNDNNVTPYKVNE